MESEVNINNVNCNLSCMDRLCPKDSLEEMAEEEQVLSEKTEAQLKLEVDLQMTGYNMENDVLSDVQKKLFDVLKIKK